VYVRPVYELRCGITTLRQKVERAYPGVPVTLHCRTYLAELVREQNPGVPVNTIDGGSALFVNGRVIVDAEFAAMVSLNGDDAVYVDGDTVVAARVSGKRYQDLKQAIGGVFQVLSFGSLPRKEVKVKVITYPWDLVSANGAQIVADFNAMVSGEKIRGNVYDGAHLINRDAIFIDEGSKAKPGVVLDGENGPIYIGKNVTLFPNCVIEGPAYVGDGSMIKIGAKIYENTSIGPVCKVGGEVEGSVIHSYSNKQHDGFLGHAYLAQWVNLGADTNNSDLKNNYGNVKVYINGESVDSGSMFVGLTMGDHSKSSINSMFNTGTVVGVSCNVFGTGFPPKYVPSFAWGGSDELSTYDLRKALEVATRVMGRRKLTLSPAEQKVLTTVFELTAAERKKAGMAR
jgi:UDP-N-acetylglucosamine diphosphorylase/glucosamine-1-phosphate N-acetyltransferase